MYFIVGDDFEMLEIVDTKIEDMIYEIRGEQVMLDSDLAKLYGCANGTKSINLAVKRHMNRFPERYMFQLTKQEYENLQFQFETASWNNYGGIRTLPFVFTEQGVAMLATILRTPIAEQVSIAIMDAFVMMRKYIANSNYSMRISNIETKLIDHDNKFNQIFDKLDVKVNNHIFFEGQIYDAYSLLVDILKEAKNKIIIIDNYLDRTILDIISFLELKVSIITSDYNRLDMNKYKEQYSNIEIFHSKKFHDRFIILDDEILYHSGASFKDLGKKCFAITKIENQNILYQLLDEIKKSI